MSRSNSKIKRRDLFITEISSGPSCQEYPIRYLPNLPGIIAGLVIAQTRQDCQRCSSGDHAQTTALQSQPSESHSFFKALEDIVAAKKNYQNCETKTTASEKKHVLRDSSIVPVGNTNKHKNHQTPICV